MGHHAAAGGPVAVLVAHLVLIGLGLVSCFFGYRLFRVLLGIWGFISGTVLGLSLTAGPGTGPTLQILAALVGGVLGAVVVSVLYLLGVFLFGAGFGWLIASMITQHWAAPSGRVLAIVLACLGGLAALSLQKPLIMVSTALGGAWAALASLGVLLTGCPIDTFPARCVLASPWTLVILCAWLGLGLWGLVTQVRQRPRRSRTDRRS